MRLSIIAIIATGVMLGATAAAPAQISYTAVINGLQEVPPSGSPATGTGTFTLNAAQTALTFNVTFSGLSSPYTVAHFHTGPAGVPGGVIRSMGGPPEGPLPGVTAGTFNGTWTTGDPESLTPWITALNSPLPNGEVPIYFNIHTAAFGGGEIRGQLTVVPEPASFILATVATAGLAWRRFRRPAAS